MFFVGNGLCPVPLRIGAVADPYKTNTHIVRDGIPFRTGSTGPSIPTNPRIGTEADPSSASHTVLWVFDFLQ
jgi:hypothetical protein